MRCSSAPGQIQSDSFDGNKTLLRHVRGRPVDGQDLRPAAAAAPSHLQPWLSLPLLTFQAAGTQQVVDLRETIRQLCVLQDETPQDTVGLCEVENGRRPLVRRLRR